METRSLGRTGLQVSAVGFGTAQLRRVTPVQAIDTLLKGFELGVNIVHTAPDYEGAEDLIGQAVARTRRKVIVASNGYDVQGNRTGRVRLFEKLFESTCRKLKTDRLDLFGIASVDDREGFGENVWGRGGMVEFLQTKKAQGRLGATFCTTHGKPEFTLKLIESGAFDAIMLAYNDLGFHLLTLNPPANWQFENIRRSCEELFPRCRERGVGLMIMLPFGGGLICRSKAFPPEDDVPDVVPPVNGADVLRSILAHPEVSCVLPGTASVEEAEENARAGHAPIVIKPQTRQNLNSRIKVLQSTVCSRCGLCEPSCSQGLPISWMFRAAHMSLYPSSPYETWEDVEYFRLHPKLTATCDNCTNVTCVCPVGLDLPAELQATHAKMLDRMERGLVVPPVGQRPPPVGDSHFAARVIRLELPGQIIPGKKYVGRLHVENCGSMPWHHAGGIRQSIVQLSVVLDGKRVSSILPREEVGIGSRCHFIFEFVARYDAEQANIRLQLQRRYLWGRRSAGLVLCNQDIPIRGDR